MTTLVANTKAQMLWEYSSQFNSYCVINGVVYGANAAGVFVVDSGDTDDTVAIASSWSFGKLELSKTDSRVAYIYASATANGSLTISLKTNDDDPVNYTITPTAENKSHRYRVPTAKGVKGKYWQMSVTNEDGCDFRVDDISLDVAASARRV